MGVRRRPERHIRLWGWLIGLVFPLAVFPFATVHEPVQTVAGLVAATLGVRLILSRAHGRLPLITALIAIPALGALALSAAALLPVDFQRRALMQPGLVQTLAQIPGFADGSRPLALHPRGALAAWRLFAEFLILAFGTALLARHRRAVRRITLIMVATGLAMVLCAQLHFVLGIENILVFSSIPVRTIQSSFPPFISANHGGVTCALLFPLALSLLGDRSRNVVLLGGLTAPALVLGTWSSGSRAAMLTLLLVLALLGLQSSITALRRGVLAAGAVLTAALVVLGATPAMERLTRLLAPRDDSIIWGADVFGGRLQTWAMSFSLIRAAPWWGTGAGSYEDGFKLVKFLPYYRTMPHAHSDILQAAVEHGVPTIILLLLALATLLGMALLAASRGDPQRRFPWFRYHLTSVLALSLYCLVDFPMRTGAVAVFAAISCGCLVGMSTHRLPPATRWVQWLFQGLFLLVSLCALTAEGILHASTWSDSPWGDSTRTIRRATSLLKASQAPHAPPGSLDLAIQSFQVAIAQRPLAQEALMKLAKAQIIAGRRDEADSTLRGLTTCYPTFPFGWLLLARMHRAADPPTEAFRAYSTLLTLDPPSPIVGREWVEEALTALAPYPALAAAVLPDDPQRLADAGGIKKIAGDREGAERCYRRAAELDPRQAAALANFLYWERHYEEALVASEVSPPSCMATRTAAAALLRLGRVDAALARFKQALDLCGTHDPATITGLAEIYLLQGGGNAEAMLRRVLDEHPDYLPARRMLMEHLTALHRWEEVREQIEWLVKSGEALPREIRELQRLQKDRGLNER